MTNLKQRLLVLTVLVAVGAMVSYAADSTGLGFDSNRDVCTDFVCYTGSDGAGWCGNGFSCANTPCPNGDSDCPAGERCAVDTCCGAPTCGAICDTPTDCGNPEVCGTYSFVCDAPPAIDGACCLPDSCAITTEDDCNAAGGTYLGDDTECFSPDGTEFDYVANPGTPIDSANPDTIDTIDVADSFIIGDLDVDFIATHSWIGDLDVTIEGPDGTTVLLQDEICGNVDNEDVVFDDEAGGALVCGSPVTGGIPAPGLLDAFDGKDAQGTWTITVTDNVGGDTGTLDQWSLHFDGGQSNCQGACCTDGPGTQSDCIEVTQDECALAGPQGGLWIGGSCDLIDDCVPLFVEIDSMSATANAAGVLIEWTTSVEMDTVGFHILRSADSRAKGRELLAFIPSAGHAYQGASYEFLDNSGLRNNGAGTVYWIEEIDNSGRATVFGPIEITGNRVRPSRSR